MFVCLSSFAFHNQSLPRRSKYKHLERSPFHCAATVQLATPDSCLVIHLARRSGRHSKACIPILKAVLCDEQFVKAGCAVDEDLMSLYELWDGLDAKSRLDLGLLGAGTPNKQQQQQQQQRRFGLKTLSKGLLGVDLPKQHEITMSDWSVVPLTEAQIMYSARDAWAGAAIAETLAAYDPDTFSHASLVSTLPHCETPIAELVSRQQRRDQSKLQLGRIVAQYPDKSRMPRSIQAHVRELRERINAPVMMRAEPRLVFLDVDPLSEC